MKRSILFASMAIAAGITMVNVYTSIVDVPAWSHNVPESVDTARAYFSVSNPGNFFRIFSPLNQLLGLLSLILFWKQGRHVRMLLAAALLLYFTGEGMTFMYFYPRNAMLFEAQPSLDANTLGIVLDQWSSMNWVRTLVVASGFVCSALALHRSYSLSTSARTDKKYGQAEPAGAF